MTPRVVVVEQWLHMHGPCRWYPHGRGMSEQLRTVVRIAEPSPYVVRSVWIRERGRWVPA